MRCDDSASCSLRSRRSRSASARGALLGGCGGSATKTVSVAEAPPAATRRRRRRPTTSTQRRPRARHRPTRRRARAAARAAPSTHAHRARAGVHAAGNPRRRRRAPQQRSCGRSGYTPNDTSEYHENQTLRVLVGTRTGSSDGYGQQAFFFLDGHYLGTDAKEPSASVKVISQSDTEVTLAYPLYRPERPAVEPQRRAGDRPLPAQQRRAHADRPHPPGELDERAQPQLNRTRDATARRIPAAEVRNTRPHDRGRSVEAQHVALKRAGALRRSQPYGY